MTRSETDRALYTWFLHFVLTRSELVDVMAAQMADEVICGVGLHGGPWYFTPGRPTP